MFCSMQKKKKICCLFSSLTLIWKAVINNLKSCHHHVYSINKQQRIKNYINTAVNAVFEASRAKNESTKEAARRSRQVRISALKRGRRNKGDPVFEGIHPGRSHVNSGKKKSRGVNRGNQDQSSLGPPPPFPPGKLYPATKNLLLDLSVSSSQFSTTS